MYWFNFWWSWRKNIIKKIGDKEVRTQTTDQNSRLYNPGAPLLAKALSQEFTSQKPKRHIDLSRFGDPVESRTENAVRFFDKDTGIGGSLQVRYGNGKVGDFPDRINNKGEAEVKDFIKSNKIKVKNPNLLGSLIEKFYEDLDI